MSIPLKADARCGLTQLTSALGHYQTSSDYQHHVACLRRQWQHEMERVTVLKESTSAELQQTTVLGLFNQLVGDNDVIIAAAGSLPGDLHRLCKANARKITILNMHFPAWVMK